MHAFRVAFFLNRPLTYSTLWAQKKSHVLTRGKSTILVLSRGDSFNKWPKSDWRNTKWITITHTLATGGKYGQNMDVKMDIKTCWTIFNYMDKFPWGQKEISLSLKWTKDRARMFSEENKNRTVPFNHLTPNLNYNLIIPDESCKGCDGWN